MNRVFNLKSLRAIYDELKANTGLSISCMHHDADGVGRWSYTGLAHHGGFWLTTEEVRALWVGGILRSKPINGVAWEGENRFKYGSFEYDTDYDPPGYLEDLVSRPFWILEQ